jgi:beta-galactosidase
MRSIFFLLFVVFFGFSSLAQEHRTVQDFNFDWRFLLGDIPLAYEVSFNHNGWRKLGLPHDWSIEGTFDEKNPAGVGGGALPGGIGWYRKTFSLPEAAAEKATRLLKRLHKKRFMDLP